MVCLQSIIFFSITLLGPIAVLYSRFSVLTVLTGIHNSKKGPSALSRREENALKSYAFAMGEAGNSLPRKHLMGFAAAIDGRKKEPSFGPKGPSEGWWQRFRERHPDVALRQPGILDGGRATTAHRSVVDRFFQLVETTMKEHQITEPSRMFNIDETGFGDKGESGRGIYKKEIRYPCQRSSSTREHITVTLCICADGKVLPPNILFKDGLPKSNF